MDENNSTCNLSILDINGVLSNIERKRICIESTRRDISVKIVLNSYGDSLVYEKIMNSCVDQKNMICLGVNLVESKSTVKTGTDISMSKIDMSRIITSGKNSFQNDEWCMGIKNMVRETESLTPKVNKDRIDITTGITLVMLVVISTMLFKRLKKFLVNRKYLRVTTIFKLR